MEHQFVVFELEGEHFGVEIAAVEGIIKMQEITRLPHAPEFMRGVTNLRGSILPVVDLRKRFDLPALETTRDTRIVISAVNGSKVGLVVDAVTQVVMIADEVIEPPPPMTVSVFSKFIKNIAKLADQMVILLDLDKVLCTEEKEAAAIR